MPDFNVRSDSVNVEHIMEQIRARIGEKRGVDYTEQQIRELAAVKLEKFLDPRGVRSDLLDPAALGITAAGPDALRGADAEFNAAVVRQLLAGVAGPIRDAVLLNAAATIAAFDGEIASAHGAVEYGLPIAAEAIDSGAAGRVLDGWIAASRAYGR